MKNKIALKVNKLSFQRTPDSKYFFKDESFELNFGQICFIKGNNGAGKSTLFKLIAGKIDSNSKTDGCITINDTKNNFDAIKMLPQKYADILASKFTFNQNLGLSKLPKFPGLKFFKPDNRIHNISKNLKVDRNIPIARLSEGQKQILAIKTTLLKNPKILLLDEPTATLDEQNANQVFMFLKELSKNSKIAIMIICHQTNFIKKYGDIILEIKQSNSENNNKSISYIEKHILVT